MVTKTNQGTALPADEEFDTVSQNGWNFFTKFLLSNVIVTVVVLLLIGLMTVWS